MIDNIQCPKCQSTELEIPEINQTNIFVFKDTNQIQQNYNVIFVRCKSCYSVRNYDKDATFLTRMN
jgi:predicted nucleic-acid-binding Zn-ribbon protein